MAATIATTSLSSWQSMLPDVMYSMIMGYLMTHDRIVGVERCCRLWRRASLAGHGWRGITSLQLRGSTRPLDPHGLTAQRMIREGRDPQTHPRSMSHLPWRYWVSDGHSHEYLSLLKRGVAYNLITSLECGSIHCRYDSHHIIRFKNVRHLTLDVWIEGDGNASERLSGLIHIPQLESLTLYISSLVKYTQPLPILPTLQHLRLYRWHDSQPLHVLMSPLPLLQSLYVDNITVIWNNYDRWQSAALRHLTIIEKKMQSRFIEHILQVSGTSLQSLSLPGYTRFQVISETCPNLTHLGLSRWHQQSHDIARVPIRLPHLTSLAIETVPIRACTMGYAATTLRSVPALLDALRTQLHTLNITFPKRDSHRHHEWNDLVELLVPVMKRMLPLRIVNGVPVHDWLAANHGHASHQPAAVESAIPIAPTPPIEPIATRTLTIADASNVNGSSS